MGIPVDALPPAMLRAAPEGPQPSPCRRGSVPYAHGWDSTLLGRHTWTRPSFRQVGDRHPPQESPIWGMQSFLPAAILYLAGENVLHWKGRPAVSGLLTGPRSEGKDPVMSTRVQGLGAVLAIVGALGIVLPLVAGWSAPCPWGAILAFASRDARRDRRHLRRGRAPPAQTRVLGRDGLGCACRDKPGPRPWRPGPGERAPAERPGTGQMAGQEVVGSEIHTEYRISRRGHPIRGRSDPAPAAGRSSACNCRRGGRAWSGFHSRIETQPPLIASGQGDWVRARRLACLLVRAHVPRLLSPPSAASAPAPPHSPQHVRDPHHPRRLPRHVP